MVYRRPGTLDQASIAVVLSPFRIALSERHFGEAKAFGMINQIGVCAPCFPIRLVEDLQFFPKNRLRQDRGERVMKGKSHEIDAAAATGIAVRSGRQPI